MKATRLLARRRAPAAPEEAVSQGGDRSPTASARYPACSRTVHGSELGHKPAAVSNRWSEAGDPGTFGGAALMRPFSLMATALAVAVIAPPGSPARAQHEHAEHFMECAKACADCQLQCDS